MILKTTGNRWIIVLGIACFAVFSNLSAKANEQLPEPISKWYEALSQGDIDLLDSILDEAAMIELKDIGITQTKAEFILSFDEWIELNGDAVLLTRLKSETQGEVQIDVCYKFKSNEAQMAEIFLITDGLITKSIQEQVSETCSGF